MALQKLGAPVLALRPAVTVPLQSAPKAIKDSECISGFLYFLFFIAVVGSFGFKRAPCLTMGHDSSRQA